MSIILDGTNGIETPAINAGNIVGEVAFFGMTTPPAGWLKANGAAISRTTYSALFAAIGTTYGAGDGSTTFDLPDLRGEFPRGWDDGRGVDSGRSFGTAQLDQFQAWQAGGVESGNQYWGIVQNPNNVNAGTSFTGFIRSTYNSLSSSQGDSRKITALNDGTNGDPRMGSETRSRNIALLACIKF